jgi:non-ribosomal peptide synthetase component F
MTSHQALLQHGLANLPSVADCAVLERETETSAREWVAYVVPAGRFVPEEWRAHLLRALPGAPPVGAFVPVAAIPRTAAGQVDEHALFQLEVIDATLTSRWEEAIRAIPDIRDVAAVAQEHADVSPPLHLADLLLDWKSSAAQAALPDTQALGRPADRDLASRAPSLSVGPPLLAAGSLPPTLQGALRRTVEHHPEQQIVCTQADGPDVVRTYSDLIEEAQRICAGLRGLGLAPGDKVLFHLDNNQDFIPAFWGCVLSGVVPVPLSIAPTYQQANAATAKLYHGWQMFDRPLIDLEG